MAMQSITDYIDANLVHSIHVSERKSFRGCRRRWSWVYKDGYYPHITAKPLEFGVAFHKAMEHWYNPVTWGIDNESRELETLLVFQRECERQKAEFLRRQADGSGNGIVLGYLEEDVQADYNERFELGKIMLRRMFKTSYQLDAGLRPVGVEVPFEVPILLPQYVGLVHMLQWKTVSLDHFIWCKCDRCWKKWSNSKVGQEDLALCKTEHIYTNYEGKTGWWGEEDYRDSHWRGLPVTFGGRIDCLFEDADLRYWVADWKTAARLATGEPGASDDFLWLDGQITGYCFAMWLLQVNVAGFIYHEIKKAPDTEPEPLKRPYMGRIYSCNKMGGYDLDTYVKTVSEGDPQGYASGLYDEFIEWLKTEGAIYHKRHVIGRNEEELRQAGINLALEAMDMVDPNLRIYPNEGRFHCGSCAFKEPCLGQNRGEDVVYTLESLFEKRERHYYETAESSTEKANI